MSEQIKMHNTRREKNRQRGQGLVEYALILSLVAIVVIIALAPLGAAVRELYEQVTCALNDPNSAGEECDIGAPCSGSSLVSPVFMCDASGTLFASFKYDPSCDAVSGMELDGFSVLSYNSGTDEYGGMYIGAAVCGGVPNGSPPSGTYNVIVSFSDGSSRTYTNTFP